MNANKILELDEMGIHVGVQPTNYGPNLKFRSILFVKRSNGYAKIHNGYFETRIDAENAAIKRASSELAATSNSTQNPAQ